MLADRLIGIIAPHSCLNCGREGTLLCEVCEEAAISQKRSSCFLCNRLTENWRTCTYCRRKTKISGVIVASHYEGVAKSLVRGLKYERKIAAANILASLMANYIKASNFDVIAAVPASSRRFRQRGYNQALVIAKRLSRRLNIPQVELLGRLGHKRQVGTNRRQRLEQMSGQMYLKKKQQLNGMRVLVIDDVVTTGATLNEAGRVLKLAGAKSIWGAAAAKH